MSHKSRTPLVGPCIDIGGEHAQERLDNTIVCLTPTQRKQLLPVRELGRGSFATVFDRPDGKTVVKITSDPTDVATALLARGDPHVVKIHKAWQLAGKPIYAMVAEKLNPTSRDVYNVFWSFDRPSLRHAYDQNPDAGTERYEVDSDTRQRIETATCGPHPTAICTKTTREIVNLHERLGKKGVRLIDIHQDNVGVDPKTKKWKMLDMGFSESGEPAVPELAALRIAKRRRCR